MMMSHVFISYSKLNWDYARSLADRLLAEGFDVWIDDRIDYGEDWWRMIVRAIRTCAAFTVVMTPEADGSRWVQREVTLADELGKPAYPLLLKGDILDSENWTMFVRTQYVDVRDGHLPPTDFYNRLAHSVPRKETQGSEVTDPTALPSTAELKPRWHTHKRVMSVETEPQDAAVLVNEVPVEAEPQFVLPDVRTVLPEPFEWCLIPEGTVVLEISRRNRPTFDLPAFAIAKYPITNAQYQVFVKALDGYRDPRWWDFSNEARAWRKSWSQPDQTGYMGDDVPRTNVTWYEAVAFTRWLTFKVNGNATPSTADEPYRISLPTEQQWQRAAQGDDNRIYPWGDQFIANRANTSESGLRRPTPVTRHTTGASPYGVFDMAGNVWEWCLNDWSTNSTDLSGSRTRILRGSSWSNDAEAAKVTFRDYGGPEERFNLRGFRILTYPQQMP
ncbi:MAG: SUMF1/EgtB/PvdO family nonheme iron enzyme [bacterium]|nr:SUMF1/EgtB/PvdO family nonheme iron enzyme [bacterium]